MKKLIFIPLLILSVLCNAQFTKGGGMFLKTGNSFMTASTEVGGETNTLLTNLVAYYSFDETTGTTFNDAVQANNGTVNAGVTIDQVGKLGRAYLFNGTSGYVNVNEITDLQMYDQDFTFALWIYVDPVEGQDQLIIGGDNGAAGIGWLWTTAEGSGGTYGRLQLAKTANWAIGDVWNCPVSQWVFVGIVFDSNSATNNLTIYINGSSNVFTADADFDNTSATNIIGARRSSGNFFKGLIDEFGIWKGRKLTDDELDDLYNSGNGRAFSYFQ
jgi:hypothetical protein